MTPNRPAVESPAAGAAAAAAAPFASNAESHSSCIFHQNWWLDAVAPGRWAAAEVRHAGQLVARLLYVLLRRGLVIAVTHPPLTPFLGPWVSSSTAKYAKRLGREKDLLSQLISQLPSAWRIYIGCTPGWTNLMPFVWAGFNLSASYTYRIEDFADPERLWADTLDNVKTDVRKARRQGLAVRTDLPLEDFLRVQRKTFARQGTVMPVPDPVLLRLDDVLASRDRRRIFFATGPDHRVHAAVYLIWDDHTAYYLMGGGDPELRGSGAHSLAMWTALEFASTVAATFDFEGSSLEPVERFCRHFGAHQTVVLSARRETLAWKLLSSARSFVRHIRNRQAF
jgi:hypothetical protein